MSKIYQNPVFNQDSFKYIYPEENLTILFLCLQNIGRIYVSIIIIYSYSYNVWVEHSLAISDELNLYPCLVLCVTHCYILNLIVR